MGRTPSPGAAWGRWGRWGAVPGDFVAIPWKRTESKGGRERAGDANCICNADLERKYSKNEGLWHECLDAREGPVVSQMLLSHVSPLTLSQRWAPLPQSHLLASGEVTL